jgi:ribose 5-phosphate isomerase B
MKIGIASDHAGYDLKSIIIKEFSTNNLSFVDCGCENSSTSVDYPDVANTLCKKLISDEFDLGILICGSGIGISIAANRFKEVRAALCHDENTACLARQHNDANILCLGARIVDEKLALKIVKSFLDAEFSGDRHQNRVNKLSS